MKYMILKHKHSQGKMKPIYKRIKRKPYPIPRIQDLLLKVEGFTYTTSFDLNMGYYHILELSPLSKEMCTIVLPWGKYDKYQKLPMGLCKVLLQFHHLSEIGSSMLFCPYY